MLFNSFEFALFFPLVFVLYWLLKTKGQNILLLLASYFFYGFWDWRFLSLIMLSTVVDYFVAQKIDNSANQVLRRRWLLASLITNLGILASFKYFNFFYDSFVDMTALAGLNFDHSILNIVLPVGISFYTFQTLSYTLDVYRRDTKPIKSLLDFGVYVAYFPQLVAGPIERSVSLLPQICNRRIFKWDDMLNGAFLVLMGLFKKVFVADNLAPYVDTLFAAQDLSSSQVILAGWLFAFQIYADFSGYSDIARGISRMLGINLRLNFDLPYASVNPQEFWRRWHISLSSWLRDYLYISLGGNRGGSAKTYRNLMLTMALGGLWHGAAWNFVLWGIYQGTILCIHRYVDRYTKLRWGISNWWEPLRILVFFQVVCYGWILFRAKSFQQIVDMTVSLFSFQPLGTVDWNQFLPLIQFAFPLLVLEWWYLRVADAKELIIRKAVLAAVLAYLFVIHGQVSESFIYFQF